MTIKPVAPTRAARTPLVATASSRRNFPGDPNRAHHSGVSVSPLSLRASDRSAARQGVVVRSSDGAVGKAPSAPLRFIQHKNEAKAFYAFLAQVYDYIVNPGHWTTDMRDEALVPADLSSPTLSVCDVGGGTGFCTQGIVKSVLPTNVTLLDQSPHQLSKARAKKDLEGVTIVEGDAEDLPFPTDAYDRYVSAGSIEYWPDPQRGICEAYRVIKPGGKACMIGPVHPTFWLSRWMADAWMLFPTEDEYLHWFEQAGFEDVEIARIGPKWYRGVRRHGLIMGCSVTGVKKAAGASPLNLPDKPAESRTELNSNFLKVALRLLLGTAAGFYYFVLPIYSTCLTLVDRCLAAGGRRLTMPR